MNRDEILKTLAALTLLAAGCGSSTCKAGSCALPDADAGRCHVGAMMVRCTGNGVTSVKITEAPEECTVAGATCENECADSEFAASCGGPPRQLPDGGTFEPSADPPSASCRNLGITPAGSAFYCCPCS